MAAFRKPWTTPDTGVGLSAQQWNHFVLLYDPTGGPSAKKLYVNGAPVATNSTSGAATDPAVNTDPIGFNSSSDGQKASARFDDVAIWTRLLTPAEIAYLYNGGIGNTTAPWNDAPSPPTNFTVTASDSSTMLAWATNAVDHDATAYALYRSLSPGGPYSPVATNLAQNAFTDSGLTNGVTYHYVIRTVDIGGAESPIPSNRPLPPSTIRRRLRLR